jgi:class 3 adenylate cyclase
VDSQRQHQLQCAPPPARQVMEAALEQHDHLLRSLLAQHGGHEVTTEGDSFTVVFHKALDAVAWCLEVQEVRPPPTDLVWPEFAEM